MQQILQRIQEQWESLSDRGKWLAGGGAALLVLTLAAIPLLLIPGGEEQNFEVLYSDLDAQDASAIRDTLETQGVKYRLENGGETIKVPEGASPSLRLDLASEGLPQRGVVGYEVFEDARLGITGPELEAMKVRAIEGELTRTIMELQPVQDTSVNVTIAPESNFLEQQKNSTAAVQLTFNEGESLSEQQVEALVHLVQRSVPRLKQEDITITDSYSNLLWPAQEGSTAVATTKQLQMKRKAERYYKNKVESLLEPIYGANNVSAQVDVLMDFDKKSVESEEFSPVVGNEGIPTMMETSSESEGPAEGEGGVPGTTTNIPGYQEPQPTEGDGTVSESEQTKIDYEVNREVTKIQEALGKITQKSVSVIVDTNEWDDSKAQVVQNLVAGAIGYESQADQITVVGQPFETGPPAEQVAQARTAQQAEQTSRLVRIGLFAALLIGLIAVLLTLISRMRASAKLVGAAAPGGKVDVLLGEELPEEEYIVRDVPEEEETKLGTLRQEITDLLEERPDDIVNALRSWILEDMG